MSKVILPRKRLPEANERFHELTSEEILSLPNISAAEMKLYLFLKIVKPLSILDVDTLDISIQMKCTQRTIQRALVRLVKLGCFPGILLKEKSDNSEEQVRDRLQSELGGQAEVVTVVGRIDLLTDTQIIEVKEFGGWKSALGQILAYSAFFPTHQKRIHLFGSAKQLLKLPDIESACLSFDILVTGEVTH